MFTKLCNALNQTIVEADTVKQVFVKGYTLHGRLIRPAMVSVEVPSGS